MENIPQLIFHTRLTLLIDLKPATAFNFNGYHVSFNSIWLVDGYNYIYIFFIHMVRYLRERAITFEDSRQLSYLNRVLRNPLGPLF